MDPARIIADAHAARIQSRAGLLATEPFAVSPTPNQIDAAVRANTAFRRVLFTGATQLVAMTVTDHIGWEVHPATTQTVVVVTGQGTGTTASTRSGRDRAVFPLRAGDAWVIEPGTWHDVSGSVQLLVLYTPPHHPIAQVQEKK